MKKPFNLLFLGICVLLLVLISGCDKQNAKTEKTETDTYFTQLYEFYKIKPGKEMMTEDQAKSLYFSSIQLLAGNPLSGYEIGENFLKYAHTVESCENYDCYTFKLADNKIIDFRIYLSKMENFYNSETQEECILTPVLLQTEFVDKAAKDTNIEFFVGDNIELVRRYYPNIQLIKNPLIDTYYFDIKNESSFYNYSLDNNGNIYLKKEIDLLQLNEDFAFSGIMLR